MRKGTASLLGLLAEYFESYLPTVKGASGNTITSYQYAFTLLFEFMESVKGLTADKVSFGDVSGDSILEFLQWLEEARACGIKTRNQRRAALLSFAKFAARRFSGETISFYSDIAGIPPKRTPKTSEIKYFTKDEVGILLQLPKTARRIGQRDITLMSVLYSSGARAQEICDLTVNDIMFGKTTKLRLVGKGRKARIVTIPGNCAKILRDYMVNRGFDINGERDRLRHVFPTQTHEKMSISCVEEVVKKYVMIAKKAYPSLFRQNRYSPHSFRHSIAVHMLECGESIAVIKAFLGHASIATTMIYASVTSEIANRYLKDRDIGIDRVKDAVPTKGQPELLSFLRKAKG